MDVIYQSCPEVVLATNTFVNVPTILQYEDTPLLEVGKFESAGYSIRFPVFHSDGSQIAVVKGSRIFLTKDGEKANLRLRQEDKLTVCELEGKPILELQRTKAAALKGWAELYAPHGVLVKCHDTECFALLQNGADALRIGDATITEGYFTGMPIGIRITRSGIQIGGSGSSKFKLKQGDWGDE